MSGDFTHSYIPEEFYSVKEKIAIKQAKRNQVKERERVLVRVVNSFIHSIGRRGSLFHEGTKLSK